MKPEDFGIKNYEWVDGKLNVNGDVELDEVKSLPFDFGVVTGCFECSYNQLTSLQGAPEKVGEDFLSNGNQLTSLQGAPKEVGGNFYCNNNQLTSLEGAPEKVEGDFRCHKNQLISLQGAPKEVGEDFDCSYNQLTSLEGAPKKVGGDFFCEKNQLTSLEGAPEEIGGNFECSHNQLTSLQGAPKKFKNFFCRKVPTTPLELLKTLLVNGKIPKEYHKLARKIEPKWRTLLKLEKQGVLDKGSEDDDLLKALEKVSK